MSEEKPLKIVKFQAENIKKLRAVTITPTGNLVEIRGKNGQGKTSILDSIWWALGGMNNVQAEPIRNGAEKARIRLDMGEVIVTRTFTKKEDGTDSKITVESANGARWSQPQMMLNSLVGELTFDPLEWSRMKPKDQYDTMKSFVPNYDFDAEARADKGDREKRADVNRRYKEKTAQLAAIDISLDASDVKIDEAALIQEIAGIGIFNANIDRQAESREASKAKAAAHRRNAEGIREEIERVTAAFEKHVADLKDEAKNHDDEAFTLENILAAAAPLDTKKDTAEVTERLEDAKRQNAFADQLIRLRALEAEADVLAKESAAITAAIEAREAAKRKAIAEAKMPVEGISFGNDEILLNGNPFDQASDAEKLRTSIAIAMAQNPRLRVIRVRDGSLLDEDALKIIAEMATDKDYQVWIEAVDSSGQVGIVIEDGAVKSTPESREKGE